MNRISNSNTLTGTKLSVFLTAACLLAPACAFAEAEHHTGILSLGVYWLNFLIYIGGLYFVCRGPLDRAWTSRKMMIEEALAHAKRDAENARQALSDAERKLQSLPTESAKLAADIERETQREGADILLQAKTRAERLALQAKDLAEAERKSTEAAIRSELVSLALKKAEERLEKEITPQSDKALRETALASVQQLVQ